MTLPFSTLFSGKWIQSVSDYYSKCVQTVQTVFSQKNKDLLQAYLTPTSLSTGKPFWAPLVACVALIGVIVMSGWAIAAFAQLLLALFIIYMILTHIFEIRLDVNPAAV